MTRAITGWHDLRKNPDDLPKQSENGTHCSHHVLSDKGGVVYYDYDLLGWFANGYPVEIKTVTAWCELPRFEE